jgi:hypothetical protein
MKTYGGAQVQLQALLTSALSGDEWSVLPPRKWPPVPIGVEGKWANGVEWNYFLSLKMEVIYSSETPMNACESTRRHIPGDSTSNPTGSLAVIID